MSDIYLSLTETPSVVTLSQPVVASVMVNTVTVANVVSVNVVTMPAINVTAAGGLTNAELRASAVTVAVTTMPALSISSVSISNFPATQTIAGTVTANISTLQLLQETTPIIYEDGGSPPAAGIAIIVGKNGSSESVAVSDLNPLPISGTVTANVFGENQAGDGIQHLKAGTDGFASSNGDGRIFAEIIGNDGTSCIDLVNGSVKVSGTVTANLGNIVQQDSDSSQNLIPVGHVQYDDSGNIVANLLASENWPFPTKVISGTVTANNPSGALTTRFGSVVTANLATLTSAVTNTSRKFLLVQNIATSTVTIGIGFAPTTTQGIQLTAGAGLTFDAFTPTGAIYWLSSVTGSNFSILEG
jgi:hypothetical protein